MTVLASEGILGYGPQTAKGTMATTWYRHRAARVEFGPQQIVQQFPLEVGGIFHPTGAFKQMVFAGGRTIFQPRLEDVFGWMLYATTGACSDIAATPEAGLTRHRFTPPATAGAMPWLSLRRYIPGATGASDNLGEIIQDARVAGMRLITAPGALLAAQVTLLAREPSLSETGVDSWTWANSFEDYQSVPLAHQGCVEIPDGTEVPATGLAIDFVNRYTTPQEEMIVGSPYPDDFAMLTQSMIVSWVYKWHNPTLYKQLLTYGEVESGGVIPWSPVVYSSSFNHIIDSPADISGYDNPYRLNIYAPEVTWTSDGPPALIAGGWLALRFVGTVQAQATPGAYYYVELDNETATYTWPS